MKLTKGKISKLYNKKRQSFKKPKRRKLSNKRRTFRNKKHLNLARKTLKRKGGGERDNVITPTEELPVTTTQENIDTTTEELPVTTTQENVDTPTEENLITPTEDLPIDTNEQNINKHPDKEQLIQSLSQVVDYITDTVSEKVTENMVSSQVGEKPQDGFDAVNEAVEIMAKTGGRKFKRTRRFRLINKNRTKKI